MTDEKKLEAKRFIQGYFIIKQPENTEGDYLSCIEYFTGTHYYRNLNVTQQKIFNELVKNCWDFYFE